MSKSAATRPRPLSPHVMHYRLIPTMIASGMHRATGAALYAGFLLFAAWLIAAAVSEAWFDCVSAVYGSWIGRFVLFGYTWAMIHHLLGGVKHLVWDTGRGFGKQASTKTATLMPFVSVGLAVLVWVAGYMARGA